MIIMSWSRCPTLTASSSHIACSILRLTILWCCENSLIQKAVIVRSCRFSVRDFARSNRYATVQRPRVLSVSWREPGCRHVFPVEWWRLQVLRAAVSRVRPTPGGEEVLRPSGGWGEGGGSRRQTLSWTGDVTVAFDDLIGLLASAPCARRALIVISRHWFTRLRALRADQRSVAWRGRSSVLASRACYVHWRWLSATLIEPTCTTSDGLSRHPHHTRHSRVCGNSPSLISHRRRNYRNVRTHFMSLYHVGYAATPMSAVSPTWHWTIIAVAVIYFDRQPNYRRSGVALWASVGIRMSTHNTVII